MKNFHFKSLLLVILSIAFIGAGCSKATNAPANISIVTPSVVEDNSIIPAEVVVTETITQPITEVKPIINVPPVVQPVVIVYNNGEVAKHNSVTDCWVIIESKIYNVTSFIPNHPGGPEKIIRNCGKDATSIFNLKHSPDKKQNLTSFYVADLQ